MSKIIRPKCKPRAFVDMTTWHVVIVVVCVAKICVVVDFVETLILASGCSTSGKCTGLQFVLFIGRLSQK